MSKLEIIDVGSHYTAEQIGDFLGVKLPSMGGHDTHGGFTFLGRGESTKRPIFRCDCGKELQFKPPSNPLAGHEVGCAVADGLPCDCDRV